MSVHLQRLRFFATTKDQPGAGADSGVSLWYYVNAHAMTTYPTKGWNSQELVHPWHGRERGRTDLYEIDFRTGDTEETERRLPVPRGIAFDDFIHARTGSFWLRMVGENWWKITHYYVLGSFQELRQVPGGGEAYEIIAHGWLLMARRDGDAELSTDPTEGATWHHIELNGTFV